MAEWGQEILGSPLKNFGLANKMNRTRASNGLIQSLSRNFATFTNENLKVAYKFVKISKSSAAEFFPRCLKLNKVT